jgi:hypothetical protein
VGNLDRMRLRAADGGAEMSEHQTIWLQPWCDECAKASWNETMSGGRTWCQDAVYDSCDCGAMPVKYILAADQPQPKPQEDDDDLPIATVPR